MVLALAVMYFKYKANKANRFSPNAKLKKSEPALMPQ